MDEWITVLLPFALLLGRISGFLGVAPIFSMNSIPMRVRAALVLLVTIFFAFITPRSAVPGATTLLGAVVLLIQEITCGVGIGLMGRMAYLGIQQGGRIAGRQMGLMLARTIDPTTGERSQPVGILFDISFMVLFLVAGGHRLLLLVLARSYQVFPIGRAPDMGALAGGIVAAGSTMLLFALKLAAPVLAAFLILAVVLAILARVLPEMNILMASMPLRVAMGLFMSAAVLPMLDSFTVDLADWIRQLMIA